MPSGSSFNLVLVADDRQGLPRWRQRSARFPERRNMAVVVFLVLTVAIFALLGLVQKLVERL